MNGSSKPYILFALLLLLSIPAWAINPVLRLDNTKSDLDKTVGAHIRLEIILSEENVDGTPWTVEFSSPRRWLTHGPLLMDAYSIGERTDRTKKITIDAIILDKGDVEIPPFRVRREGETDTLETNSLQLQSKSNFKSQQEAKSAKPAWLLEPLTQGGLNSIVLGIIAALLLALGAYLVYLFVRYLRLKCAARKPSPKVIADKDILSLRGFIREASDRPDFTKEFSFQVTEVMRKYLSKRLNLPLLESTDKELLHELTKRAFGPEQITKCSSILNATFAQRYYRGERIDKDGAARLVNALSEIIADVESDFSEKTLKIEKGASN